MGAKRSDLLIEQAGLVDHLHKLCEAFFEKPVPWKLFLEKSEIAVCCSQQKLGVGSRCIGRNRKRRLRGCGFKNAEG
jgi:hypothetical protein